MTYAENTILAEAKGFTVTSDANNQSFELKDYHIWFCRDGWQTALLIDGHFVNHEMMDSLKEAFDNRLVSLKRQYHENEEGNAHADNYSLLADNFGNDHQQLLAHEYQIANYDQHEERRISCHREVNPLYYSHLTKEAA